MYGLVRLLVVLPNVNVRLAKRHIPADIEQQRYDDETNCSRHIAIFGSFVCESLPQVGHPGVIPFMNVDGCSSLTCWRRLPSQ